jgi:hypothetical protein
LVDDRVGISVGISMDDPCSRPEPQRFVAEFADQAGLIGNEEGRAPFGLN